jgi:hypothetical protein
MNVKLWNEETGPTAFLLTLPKFCPECGSDKIAGENYDAFKHEERCACPQCGFAFQLRNDYNTIERALKVAEIVCEYTKFSCKGLYSLNPTTSVVYGNGHFGCRGCYDYEEDWIEFPTAYFSMEDGEIHKLEAERKRQREEKERLAEEAASRKRQQDYEAGILAQAQSILAKREK